MSGKTGLYLLNIDTQGEAHHDLTGDLVFPAMLGVADPETERRVLDILYTPMFWTPYGMRTVAVGEHNYDPEFGIRLVGGIWPNLTVWVSYANRKLYPDRLVEGMRNSYRICEVPEPKKFKNLVPGEFPECLHGENFQSRGMALSPWMPPTYLWLAVEGLLGIEPTTTGLRVAPNLESGWTWAAARSVPYGGGTMSLFLHDGTLYTTQPAESDWPQKVYAEDVSSQIHCNAFVVALRAADGRAAILVCADTATQVELTLAPLPDRPARTDHPLPPRCRPLPPLGVRREGLTPPLAEARHLPCGRGHCRGRAFIGPSSSRSGMVS